MPRYEHFSKPRAVACDAPGGCVRLGDLLPEVLRRYGLMPTTTPRPRPATSTIRQSVARPMFGAAAWSAEAIQCAARS